MVAEEISGTPEPFWFLKNVDLAAFDDVSKAAKSQNFITNPDIYALASLGRKLVKICGEKKLASLHAIFCNINLPFFVAECNPNEFRFFYECKYSPLSGKYSFLEKHFYTNDSRYVDSNYYVSRYNEIVLVGEEIIIGQNPRLKSVEERVDGQLAILVQHEIEIQSGRFVFEYANRVEIQ